MKHNKSLFLLTMTITLILSASSLFAMDLAPRSIDSHFNANANTSSSANLNGSDDSLLYPGRVSFILGFSHLNVKNAQINDLSITPVNLLASNSFQNKAASLNGFNLGINQFLSYHFGYEFNLSYYLSKTYSSSYTGVYDPNVPNVVTATASTDNKLLTTELLAIGGLHLTQNILLVGKLGLGYARLNQDSTIQASFSSPGTPYTPYEQDNKQNNFGLAGGLGLRFDLNDNFSLNFGINDLHAKQNFMAYQANLLMRL